VELYGLAGAIRFSCDNFSPAYGTFLWKFWIERFNRTNKRYVMSGENDIKTHWLGVLLLWNNNFNAKVKIILNHFKNIYISLHHLEDSRDLSPITDLTVEIFFIKLRFSKYFLNAWISNSGISKFVLHSCNV